MLKRAILIFVIWRIGLFIVSWVGSFILPFSPRFPYADILLVPSNLPSWIWSFANFDGVHYLTIAKSGYWAQFTQVFFPLYPLAIRIIIYLFPFLNSIVIGLFISNMFFLLSIIIFLKLLEIDFKASSQTWIIIFFVTFPTSFFFGSLYTESFFLFLILSAFYAARNKKWFLAGILGALASATRFAGILLVPALIWEWWEERKIKNKTLKMKKPKEGFLKYYLHFLFYTMRSPIFYLVPLGLLSYMIYLQIYFKDWLIFWHVQPVFGAERTGGSIVLLPQVIWRYIKILSTATISNEIYWISLLELMLTMFSFTLLIYIYKIKVRISYLIYALLTIIVPTLTGTFSSMPRYILVAFPIFIALGMIKSKTIKIILLIINTILLCVLTILFTRGHWVS